MDRDRPSRRLKRTFEEIDIAADVATALHVFQSAYSIDFVTYHLSQTVADIVDAPFVRTTYEYAPSTPH